MVDLRRSGLLLDLVPEQLEALWTENGHGSPICRVGIALVDALAAEVTMLVIPSSRHNLPLLFAEPLALVRFGGKPSILGRDRPERWVRLECALGEVEVLHVPKPATGFSPSC